MNNKAFFYGQFYLLMTLFWIALFENVHLMTLITGLIFSVLVIFFTEKYLLKDDFYQIIDFNAFKLLIYFFILLYEIYANAFVTIHQIITLQINPDIVEIHTDLKSNTQKCILANSITLTPGTVTIDLEGHTLKVLWLNAKSKNTVIAGNMIKGRFERFLNR
ncbi:Na+/H+ antiporter subunit E [Fusibacter sp. 3D3]|uniref:Na+/H+ antiporter subunit E n=1 Tax=Fusibacter sp. 3D3 TaxID=1048380 RepID=UPI000853CEC5|nr:Na+/H+ antiporter subunit E [Fusibacter sp. 3D3]GAU77936.1 Na(+) H(+) antiporter subunit E [Fusibacter sp. 3D3]